MSEPDKKISCMLDSDISKDKCCCNCTQRIPLFRHPWNSGYGKGKISQQCGWVCMGLDNVKGRAAIYQDHPHGLCEMHIKKETV